LAIFSCIIHMKRIAVLGAGGFVGTRFIELAALSGTVQVVPVIRSFKGAARLARFGRIWQVADAGSVDQLRPVIGDCDAVVNLTVGDLGKMAGATDAVWQACAAARVPRLIHLSSAVVFGCAEQANLQDDSPPLANHWMGYARAKAAAEERLRPRLGDDRVACVILRPGLVWGPRSPWVEEPARELIAGNAFLLGAGKGICNLHYVDNLIYSILGVVQHPAPSSGFYNVSDDEVTRWCDYYSALAHELNVEYAEIHQFPGGEFQQTLLTRLEDFKETAMFRWLKRNLGKQTKQRLKRTMSLLRKNAPVSGPTTPPEPVVTRSVWDLQNTRHKLPTEKFARTFGGLNRLSFSDAMARTGEWLRFAGFARP
jgi:2-alkyl-3-oxoalkanoate reductase